MAGREEGRLDGKVAIVMRAGQGIGEAIAVVYARAGAKVVLTGRTRAKLDGVCEPGFLAYAASKGGHPPADPDRGAGIGQAPDPGEHDPAFGADSQGDLVSRRFRDL